MYQLIISPIFGYDLDIKNMEFQFHIEVLKKFRAQNIRHNYNENFVFNLA